MYKCCKNCLLLLFILKLKTQIQFGYLQKHLQIENFQQAIMTGHLIFMDLNN